MFTNTRPFFPILLACVVACALLEVEEAIHFFRYGWNSPDNVAWTRDVSACKAVPRAGGTDIECPVEGYGWARYRYIGKRGPLHNRMVYVDRVQ